MESRPFLRRAATEPLERALNAMPIVVVTGARQTGKSTLVRELAHIGDRWYVTLDDLDALDQASRDPEELIGRAERLTVDEVQREPRLLLAIKRAVDRRRRKGQFVLTGSANLLLMDRVAESLAGRAVYLTLWPMTRREQLGLASSGEWESLLRHSPSAWPELLRAQTAPQQPWATVARRGGYPDAALEADDHARTLWFDGYTRTYLERDVPQLSNVSSLPDLRRLMRAASLRVGQLVNQAELGRDVSLAQPTVHRWLNLLETSYQLVRLPSYSVNRTKRLIKTPKLYWSDTGLALHLAGTDEITGAYLENLVLTDLLVWRDTRARTAEVLYWRTASGEEVDFVIEADGQLLPIEVKATRRARTADAAPLLAFQAEYGSRAKAGLLLYDGEDIEWIAKNVLAVPWWRVM